MISNKGLVSINAFINSCDDLINGKFIFAGNKVSNILIKRGIPNTHSKIAKTKDNTKYIAWSNDVSINNNATTFKTDIKVKIRIFLHKSLISSFV